MSFDDRTIIPLCSGVHVVLEAEADRLIHDSLIGVTKHSEKADILTPWKMQDRLSREVYMRNAGYGPDGAFLSPGDVDVTPFAPDAATRRGFFHRVANLGMLHLNSTYRTATVLPRHRGVTMWDLRTDCGKVFPVEVRPL